MLARKGYGNDSIQLRPDLGGERMSKVLRSRLRTKRAVSLGITVVLATV